MLRSLLGKLVGDPNAKELERLQPTVERINALEPEMRERSAEELRQLTESSAGAWPLRRLWRGSG